MGALTQLAGASGCLVDRSARNNNGCAVVRALKGPGPFMGSRAIVLSPDGKSVYVASSKSDAIAIFRRDTRSGELTQPRGAAGCIAVKAATNCAAAIALDGPNSLAVSPDGRNVYATSRASNSLSVFQRNQKTGALTQLPASAGCISGVSVPVCAAGRALVGPDVVVVSPEGENVYVGSFFGNAVAVFDRDPTSGALTQPGDSSGCIAEAISGCALGFALGAPEGMAISGDGASLYVASALSNAVVTLARDQSSGNLSQASDSSGCVANAALTGCTPGVQLEGANAVAFNPGGDVYVTSLISNSVTAFTRSTTTGGLVQKPGTAGCLVWLRAVGCSFGRALRAPEGIAVSPDGANVYVAAFANSTIDVLDRGKRVGKLKQKPGRRGCVAPRSVPGCTPARALRGVSSLALSPDGRHLYSTSFGSDAVDVFRRNK
ncbi:MAG TPA: YncE family protein [Solirubrobacterales bacterium]|nr:YncE family protein [Solirubrobacterales bacterium]